MTRFLIVRIKDMVDELGEERVSSLLSSFSCPLNLDVESFLHRSAIMFMKQWISVTYLVFTQYKGKQELVAYFTLANKFFTITRGCVSENMRKRICKYGQFDRDLKRYVVPAPLIAQIGKNYSLTVTTLISGDDIIRMACDKIKQMQGIVGGKVVFLECENHYKLLNLYERNGFREFSRRPLDQEEKEFIKEDEYIQMVKIL